MLTNLKKEHVLRPYHVPAFTGTGTCYEVDGHEVVIVSANPTSLKSVLKVLHPSEEFTEKKFQAMSIIQAQ